MYDYKDECLVFRGPLQMHPLASKQAMQALQASNEEDGQNKTEDPSSRRSKRFRRGSRGGGQGADFPRGKAGVAARLGHAESTQGPKSCRDEGPDTATAAAAATTTAPTTPPATDGVRRGELRVCDARLSIWKSTMV